MNGTSNSRSDSDIFPIVGTGFAFPIKPSPARPIRLAAGTSGAPSAAETPGLGRGGGSPWSNKRGSLRWLSGEDKIRQSIWIILSTAPGERQMRPDFGCGIQDLVFKPNTAAFRGLVRDKVEEALLRYEPRIDLIEISVTASGTLGNQMDISIDYRLRTNNAFFNLVYPFYLKEGVGATG